MSHRHFYHGRRRHSPASLSTSIYARAMFFFILAVMFAAAIWRNPVF